jgi:hypothetical protein
MRADVLIRQILLLVFLAAAVVAPTKAQARTEGKTDVDKIKSEIIKLQDEEDRALLRSDAVALNRLWDDGILFPFDDGEVLTKSQRIAQATSKVHNFDVFRHDDIRVRVFNGNTAVITVFSATEKKLKGAKSGGPRVASAAWVKVDGQWRMVEHQVTDMSKQ